MGVDLSQRGRGGEAKLEQKSPSYPYITRELSCLCFCGDRNSPQIPTKGQYKVFPVGTWPRLPLQSAIPPQALPHIQAPFGASETLLDLHYFNYNDM